MALMVREEGFEPPRACARQVLSLLRLPVPPFPQSLARKVYHALESPMHSVPPANPTVITTRIFHFPASPFRDMNYKTLRGRNAAANVPEPFMSRDARTLLDLYNPNNPLDHASTIPSPWYFDESIAELENSAVFGKSWQAVGRTDQVQKPGQF